MSLIVVVLRYCAGGQEGWAMPSSDKPRLSSASTSHVGVLERHGRVEFAGEEALAEGAPGHEADPELIARPANDIAQYETARAQISKLGSKQDADRKRVVAQGSNPCAFV